MERITEVLKNWVQVNMNQLKTGRPLPHMSFILSKILSHPTSYGLIRDKGPYEILKLAYTVFFMFEGDDFEVAQQKSNDLYFIEVTEIENIEDGKEECGHCDGHGTVACDYCDGEGEETCYECDGLGDFDGKTCDLCNGKGNVTCSSCGGSGEDECQECSGHGEVDDQSVQIVDYSQSYWVTYSPDFIEDMKRKIDGDSPNDDFYSDADKDGAQGDLTLLGSIRKEEDIDDLDFPGYDVGDTMVTDIAPLDELTNIINLFVYQGGTRNGHLKVR
jgi:hypothetical protein